MKMITKITLLLCIGIGLLLASEFKAPEWCLGPKLGNNLVVLLGR